VTPPDALRRRLRAARRAIPPARQRLHARRLARVLGRHPRFLRARRIGAYCSADGELDPSPLLALDGHKRCYLPVLRPHPKRKLWFVRHRPGDRLRRNAYGIPEPQLRNRHIRLPWGLDLLLMPLVGFDAQGHRLGMGGGYYDRTLAYLAQRRRWRRPVLVGIAHECQRVERLEPNPWDVPLDMVATEERVLDFTRGRNG
jgi:5-formyltetrahydrofolate cyclo-ligase